MLIKNERLIKLSFINSYSSFLEKISTIYKPDNISIKMNKSISVRLVHISSGKRTLSSRLVDSAFVRSILISP